MSSRMSEVTVDGVRKRFKEKLHMYVAEARFLLARPPGSIDLASLVTLPFIERIDPAIKHRLITSAEAVSPKDPRAVNNQHPLRRWCETQAGHDLHSLALPVRGQAAGRHPDRQQAQGRLQEARGLPRVRERAHAAAGRRGHRDGACDLDRPRHGAGRRARAEHLLRQPGDAVRQAAGGLPAASDRRKPDRRDRVHGARGRDRASWRRRKNS